MPVFAPPSVQLVPVCCKFRRCCLCSFLRTAKQLVQLCSTKISLHCAWALSGHTSKTGSTIEKGESLAALSLLRTLLVDGALRLTALLIASKQIHVGEKVVFVPRRGMSTSTLLSLYLADYDSHQETSGHIWMPLLRPVVYRLAPEKIILYCHQR